MARKYHDFSQLFGRFPREQHDTRQKRFDFALAVASGRETLDPWPVAIETRASLRSCNDYPTAPTPHTRQFCQNLVIDVSEPVDPWLLQQGMANPKGIDFNCSLRDVEEGSLNGCPLMTRLCQETQIPSEEEQRDGFFRWVADATMQGDVNGFELTGLSKLHLNNIKRPWEDWRKKPYKTGLIPSIKDVYFDVHAELDDAAQSVVRNLPVLPNPADEEIIRVIKHNLHYRINEQHSFQRDLPDLTKLPTRLMHVAKVDGAWHIHLEVVKHSAIRYSTLSYCWGITPRGLTTNENLNLRRNNLDFAELPKTIQDAVIVTEKLGLTYLWVDAICIVQDNNEDKAREIAKMSSIYSNSALTICASRALTADEGFLHPRPQFQKGSQSYRLPFKLPGDQGLGTVILGQSTSQLTENRLHTRAWAFQERIMSRRILDFDGQATSIHWREPGGRVHIRDGGSVNHARAWSDADSFRGQDFQTIERKYWKSTEADSDHNQDSPVDPQSIECMNDWTRRICQYTECQVTLSTDRILAIASIAERFAMFNGNYMTYLAGLWEEHLPWMIMWSMKDRETRPSRPSAYQGPSWSWTGVNGKIHCYYPLLLRQENAEFKCEIIGYDIDPEYAHGPYGSLRSATLVIAAKARKARWLRGDKAKRGGDYDDLAYHFEDPPLWSLDSSASGLNSSIASRRQQSRKGQETVGDKDGGNRETDLPEVYTPQDLLPAKMRPDALEPKFAISIADGGAKCLDVVLLQCFRHEDGPLGLVVRDCGEGVFQRVGIFTTEMGHNHRRVPSMEGKGADEYHGTDQVRKDTGEEEGEDGEKTSVKGKDEDGCNVQIVDARAAEIKQLGAAWEQDLQKEVAKKQQTQLKEEDCKHFANWFDQEHCEERIFMLV